MLKGVKIRTGYRTRAKVKDGKGPTKHEHKRELGHGYIY